MRAPTTTTPPTPKKQFPISNVDPAELDAFKRLGNETHKSDNLSFLATGTTEGPGNFNLWLGQGAPPTQWEFIDRIYPQPDSGAGQWEVPLSLPDGEYTLKATAGHLHPDGMDAADSISTFTVDTGGTGEQRYVTNTYDSSGRLLSRSWAGGNVTQSFTWDATGKLVKVAQEDIRTAPQAPSYIWSALYDPSGRRIQTTYLPNGAPHTNVDAARTIKSWYDPQIEFLEIAVEMDGKRWWKFYGPDLNGDYGQLQGIGGLEVIVDEETELLTPIIDNIHGHVVGHVDLKGITNNLDDEVIANNIQMSGYGPLPGYEMTPLEKSGNLIASIAWQSRRIDPTGMFYMGARYYDPEAGRFISPDPLGHEASMELYSYANGDPINFVDPAGREWWNSWSDYKRDFSAGAGIIWDYTLGHTRVQGGLKMIGGGAEVAVGGAAWLTPEPTMATKVLGTAAIVHGADTTQSGFRQMWYGEATPSFTSQAVTNVTGSETVGELTDAGVGVLFSGGTSLLTRGTTTTSQAGGRVTQFFNPSRGSFGNTATEALTSSPSSTVGRIIDGADAATWVAPGAADDLTWAQRFWTGRGNFTNYVEFDALPGELTDPSNFKSIFSAFQQNISGSVALQGRNPVFGELGTNYLATALQTNIGINLFRTGNEMISANSTNPIGFFSSSSPSK